MLAIGTNSGKVIASADIVSDTDDLFYDAARGGSYERLNPAAADVEHVVD